MIERSDHSKSKDERQIDARLWARRLLPRTILKAYRSAALFVRTGINFVYDFRRYTSGLSPSETASTDKQIYELVKDYHKIEKGLSLKSMRPLFGREVVDRILKGVDNLSNGAPQHGRAPAECAAALSALNAYVEVHEKLGYESEVKTLKDKLATLVPLPGCEAVILGGIEAFSADLLSFSVDEQKAATRVLLSRRSVRDFRSMPLLSCDFERAAELAHRAPSVCNRQTCRATLVRDKNLIDRVLTLQNGNAGFRSSIHNLIVVTVSLEGFLSAHERNQPWFDAGLFAMSLLSGLTIAGVASCCLNWCVDPASDRRAADLIGLTENERIAVLIAAGYPPSTLKVCRSPRFNSSSEFA